MRKIVKIGIVLALALVSELNACDAYKKLSPEPLPSEIAREYGVRYLLWSMPQEWFPQLFHWIRVRANRRGLRKITDEERELGIDIDRFDGTLYALADIHEGVFVADIMARSKSFSQKGYCVLPKAWKIGILFPVELLDRGGFRVTDLNGFDRVDASSLAISLGVDYHHYDHETSPLNHLRTIIEDIGTNLDSRYAFSLKGPLPIEDGVILWVPAPAISSPHIGYSNLSELVRAQNTKPAGTRAFRVDLFAGWSDRVPHMEYVETMQRESRLK